MNLVYYEHLISAVLRGYSGLFHKRLDMFHRVVGCGVELENIKRTLLGGGYTALALSASIACWGRIEAIYSPCEYASAGGFADSPWSAEEVGMSQFAGKDGVLQGSSQGFLSDHIGEGGRAIFSGRNYIIIIFLAGRFYIIVHYQIMVYLHVQR